MNTSNLDKLIGDLSYSIERSEDPNWTVMSLDVAEGQDLLAFLIALQNCLLDTVSVLQYPDNEEQEELKTRIEVLLKHD